MRKLLFLFFLLCLVPGLAGAATLKIDGTTNVEDTRIISSVPDNNYGGATIISVTPVNQILIRVQNLSSLLPAGATITSCVCSLYCTTNTVDDTLYSFRLFKPWVEGDEDGVDDDDGDVTHNDWASDADEWGTAGAACANDDGSDNSQDGTCDASGRDRKATEEGITFVNTVNTWYAFPVSAALAQDWYDGDANENGIILIGDRLFLGNNIFASTENATAANRPYWTITYTVGNPRRNREIRQRSEREENHNPVYAHSVPVICQ